MVLALIAIVWWLLGAVGSALALEFFFRRDGLDIKISDCLLGGFVAFAGPISLAVGLLFTAVYFLAPLIDTQRVVFRRRAR